MPFRIGHIIIVFAWLLSIVALTLIFISYLSPFPERHRALITIIPNMTAEQYLASENETINAPSITIGLFGENGDTLPLAKFDHIRFLRAG